MTFVLCLIFFLSGISALLFETLWFHQAGLLIGNSVLASSLVLSAFMGGLALGNALMGWRGDRVRRPIALYALLEILIGLSGFALVVLLPSLPPILEPLLRLFRDYAGLGHVARFSLIFSLLVLPATAMGITLPLLVAVLFRRDARFGRALGLLYGWNTLGAVVGAVIGPAFLIAWLGVRGTALLAAAANVVAAVVALAVARSRESERHSDARGQADSPPRLTGRASLLLAAAFSTGAILLALEVVWFRFLQLFAFGTTLAFAAMLAVVLAGIALGGLVGSWWLSRRSGAHTELCALACLGGAATIATYALFESLSGGNLWALRVDPWRLLRMAVPLMVPAAIVSGVLFTFLGEALNREVSGDTRSAGLLVLSNTGGAMLGSLVAGFVLLPVLGVERTVLVLGSAYGGVALLVVLAGVRPQGRIGAASGIGAAALLAFEILLFPSGLLRDRFVATAMERFHEEAALAGSKGMVVEPVFFREGRTETLIYLRRSLFGETLDHRLVTNGYSMASNSLYGRRYMKLFVYWPVAVHPDPKTALLISYGVGATAKALTDTRDLESIDVVDISRNVLDSSVVVYPDLEDDPLRDPRVRVHIEDGRHFLQTTDRSFDLITAEPPPPKGAGIVNLYTREYFGLARRRLAEGGILTYWLPVNNLLEKETQAIVGAFCAVFDDCSLWNAADMNWMLVGTNHLSGPAPLDRFTRQWRDPTVEPELRDLGIEVPGQLGALFMADYGQLRALTGDAPILEDDHPGRLGHRLVEPAGLREVYRPWTDTAAARSRFEESDFVRRIWPSELRKESFTYFGIQARINAHLANEPLDTADRLAQLHESLTESRLRTLPLWVLATTPDRVSAATRARASGRREASVHYQLALGALSDRDWERALSELAAFEHERGEAGAREIRLLRIYALGMAGRLAEARKLARAQPRPDAKTLRVLTSLFDLDPDTVRPPAANSGNR